MQGAIEGAAQGITSVGLNYLVEEMDVNPLLANIGFSAISTAINSTLQSFAPTGEKDIFKHIYETYEKNALTFLGAGDPSNPNYAWQQAAYIAQIQDFTHIIKEEGFTTALNTYATGFFNSTAVNAILSTGKTIGAYFETKLNAGDYTIETKDDKKYAKVAIEDAQSNEAGEAYFGWLEETQGWDDFMGTTEADENGIDMYRWGDLYKDVNGDVGYYGYSELYNQWGDIGVFQTIQDGYQKYVEIRDDSGDILFVAEPKVEGKYNCYNSSGEYINVKITETTGTVHVMGQDSVENIEIKVRPDENGAPWDVENIFTKYNAGTLADWTDEKLDLAADYLVEKYEGKMGYVFTATTVWTLKDLVKILIVDTLRLGEDLGALSTNVRQQKYLKAANNIIQEGFRVWSIYGVSKDILKAIPNSIIT